MKEIIDIYPQNKTEMYQLLVSQLKSLCEDETEMMPNLANCSALLNGALKDINWVGFYITMPNEKTLILGPFQGKTACIRIPFGKGVCGTAAKDKTIQLVKDVHQFPGHIACDSASNSEIVLPIIVNDKVVAVLDIDSPSFSRFDEQDKQGLSEIVKILEQSINWN